MASSITTIIPIVSCTVREEVGYNEGQVKKSLLFELVVSHKPVIALVEFPNSVRSPIFRILILDIVNYTSLNFPLKLSRFKVFVSLLILTLKIFVLNSSYTDLNNLNHTDCVILLLTER